MKRYLRQIVAAVALLCTAPAKAQFSTDAPILLEILSNSISQLYQLMEVVQVSQSNLELLQEIREGMDNALQIYETLKAPTNPGQYQDWRNIGLALDNLRRLYGKVAKTSEADVQLDIDRGVAEAIDHNNKAYEYANELEALGQRVEQYSGMTSPKGAERLTAQSMGILLQAQNQAIKTEASNLKLQAQALALQNRKDKEYSRRIAADTDTLKTAMKGSKTRFDTPRF
jgi:hypothetical protein